MLLPFSHCEACRECRSGHPTYCHTFNSRNFGGTRPGGTSTMRASAEPGSAPVSSFFGQSPFGRHILVYYWSTKAPRVDGPGAVRTAGVWDADRGGGHAEHAQHARGEFDCGVWGGSIGMAAGFALVKELRATHGVMGSEGDVVK